MQKKNPNKLLGKLSPTTNQLLGRDVKSLQESFVNHLEFSLGKDRYSATQNDYLKSLIYTMRDRLYERWIETQQTYYRKDAKRIYYISMEYMMGRLLSNAALNLGLQEPLKKAVWELGIDMEQLSELESDFGLGNGGLGRLAACFLDSMATLELPANAYGIRYEYGIFAQKIQNGYQFEAPDQWLRFGNPWELDHSEYAYPVHFYGHVIQQVDSDGRLVFMWQNTDDVLAAAYDVPIPGYQTNTVNSLRLWAAKSSEDFNLNYFNHGNYAKAVQDKVESENISKILYPRDDFMLGRELRLKQEYFLSSATLQDIMRRFKKTCQDFTKFPEKVAIQLNDTHPVLCIPELMRQLIDDEKIPWEKAWDITTKTFGYTNHTILQEALETWRVELLGKLLPRHLQIINEINFRFLNEIRMYYTNDQDRVERMSVYLEGPEKKIRMANLAIIGSHSVNGVAQLHSEILKDELFRDFYDYWPEKFNNKTNGITQRRWLLECNPNLAELITEYSGDGWIKDLDQMKSLEKYLTEKKFISRWQQVKLENKKTLAAHVQNRLNVTINPESIFDCQVKRFHEYKRQLLNVLHIISLYNRIQSGEVKRPVARTFIFAGKAAPAYFIAKLIIKLIINVGEKIAADSKVSRYLNVVFIPDYSVSWAQKIIPAADLSEQISTAGMEASGTGNMKFALNGALTIGTLDGANIEIRDDVGDENIFIFGLQASEVIEYRREGTSQPADGALKNVLDQIARGDFSDGDTSLFRPLVDSLYSNDYYALNADFTDYAATQDYVRKVYRKKDVWTRMSVRNSANMGRFSSDRTIREYNRDIWNVKPVKIKLMQTKN